MLAVQLLAAMRLLMQYAMHAETIAVALLKFMHSVKTVYHVNYTCHETVRGTLESDKTCGHMLWWLHQHSCPLKEAESPNKAHSRQVLIVLHAVYTADSTRQCILQSRRIGFQRSICSRGLC